ncbi:hypothetical protein PALB_16020 [Pseudoalteromonas luteoviolacea B = ATCC 29581]|nr:hypothetical protein PALB_16020 [Pseudoalteromonas luteoviolacea B = ATCC 29581]
MIVPYLRKHSKYYSAFSATYPQLVHKFSFYRLNYQQIHN